MRILDPRRVAVTGVDSHLAPLRPRHWDPQVLRRRFEQSTDFEPEHHGDGRLLEGRSPALAAVLVPLVHRDEGLAVLLTRRTEHLRDHAGQISFPGGRVEPGDASAEAAALREAWEEVGLDARQVEVLGRLPAYTTVTHFVVTPVVALVTPPLALQLDANEVAEAFEVPLAFLMNPAHHRRHRVVWDGGEREFLSMPWTGPGPDGLPREHFIWGATAAMLRNLYRFLSSAGA